MNILKMAPLVYKIDLHKDVNLRINPPSTGLIISVRPMNSTLFEKTPIESPEHIPNNINYQSLGSNNTVFLVMFNHLFLIVSWIGSNSPNHSAAKSMVDMKIVKKPSLGK
jgi:hypothetical protein